MKYSLETLQRFKQFELNDNDKAKHTFTKDGVTYHRSYLDPKGKWTIGYGSMIEDDGLTKEQMKNLVITEEEAEARLIKELEIAENDIKKFVPVFDNLDHNRQEALIQFSFSLGLPGLQLFEGGQTLHNINCQAWYSAADSLKRTKWAKDVGEIRSSAVIHAIKFGLWPGHQNVL